MSDQSCPNCAQAVPDGAQICPHCGIRLAEPEAVVTTEPRAPGGVPWRAVEAFFVFLIHLVVTAVVVGVLTGAGLESDTLLVAAIFTSEVLLIATTLGWVSIRYGLGPRALGLRDFTGQNLGIGIGMGAFGLFLTAITSAILISVIEAVSDDDVAQPDQIELASDPEGALLFILAMSVVVLAPIAEETFFRGFLFAGLRRWARVWPAVLISSAIFAVVHVIPLVMPPIFVLGILLAWVVERRTSIVPAIVAHLTFNAVGFWLMFVDPVQGVMR